MMVADYRLHVPLGGSRGRNARTADDADPTPGLIRPKIRQTHQQGYSCRPSLEGLDWRRVHDARETRVPIAAS